MHNMGSIKLYILYLHTFICLFCLNRYVHTKTFYSCFKPLSFLSFCVVNAVSIAMGSDDNFSVPKAPTKEEMSLSTYTARRKLNRLRRSACQLFTSEAMVKAIQRLELEVEAKRLLVRKDRHLWKDIGK